MEEECGQRSAQISLYIYIYIYIYSCNHKKQCGITLDPSYHHNGFDNIYQTNVKIKQLKFD